MKLARIVLVIACMLTLSPNESPAGIPDFSKAIETVPVTLPNGTTLIDDLLFG
jgi:hypothetical protein